MGDARQQIDALLVLWPPEKEQARIQLGGGFPRGQRRSQTGRPCWPHWGARKPKEVAKAREAQSLTG